MKYFLVILLSIGILGCGKTEVHISDAAQEKVTPGWLVTILDVRKTEECEDQTLMEQENKLRFTRCGYFGKVGDQFYYYEK